MHYQFVDYDVDAPYLGGDIVGPMGEFYCAILNASPAFIEFMLKALNSQPAKETREQATTP